MRILFDLVLSRPRTALVVLIIPNALFAFFLPRLEKETVVTNMLPAGHSFVLFSKEVEEEFGVKKGMLIGVIRNAPEGIYDTKTLRFLSRLTERLQATEGILPESVKGLFSADDIIGTPDGFIVAPLLPAVPWTGPEFRALQHRFVTHRLLRGELVSTDGS